MAGWSRFASSSFEYPDPNKSLAEFAQSVATWAAEHPGCLVLPMTEQTTQPISEYRDLIVNKGAKLVLPDHDVLLRAFDKSYTTGLARQLGVAVPDSETIHTPEQAMRLAREFSLPAVLKALSSQQKVAGGMQANPRPFYARTAKEFMAGYERLCKSGGDVLAQEFVEGVGFGYFALMCHGELRCEFAHKRLRDVHPTGSGSSVRISIEPTNKMREWGLAILKELRWHGVAMVEYRVREDGTPVFLEVNGRFWNSLALAIYSGCDFPAMLAEMAENGDVQPSVGYKTGVRCRWLLGDFRHLLEVWKGAPAGFPGKFPGRLKTLVDCCIPVAGTYHDNFSLDDPLPELGDWVNFFARKVPGLLTRSAAAKPLKGAL
jgi:predicted ATP-grasp superfamily ATP-dependent carboligase